MDHSKKQADPVSQMETIPAVKALMQELKAGLSKYWKTADTILGLSGVTLAAPSKDYFTLDKNFFSLLFLYSFHRAGIPHARRILYAATLQCLRGMVTGCDNLLDDEYKKTLETDIPETGFRFRSVIDIMVSDRVLFQVLIEASRQNEITLEQVVTATSSSMKTMTRSGVQEASEEAGIATILEPNDLLQKVHHYKTGILFQCPWDIPMAIEDFTDVDIAPLMKGLYQIGMGCQIMDDMVDFRSDLERKRHNFLVALIYHGSHSPETDRLCDLIALRDRQPLQIDLAGDFPNGLMEASAIAHQFLESGLDLLFSEEHQPLAKPAIQFLEKKIGINHLIPGKADDL